MYYIVNVRFYKKKEEFMIISNSENMQEKIPMYKI